MDANPLLGVILQALGGFAAGSFYIPFKKVKGWAWESYWLVGGSSVGSSPRGSWGCCCARTW
ncbi:MAG: L-rhamnose/proton symporter RhaT [Phycisphaerae bacterium]